METTPNIKHISAVTFAVSDMAKTIGFYQKLGLNLVYGGNDSSFTSLRSGECYVNLSFSPGYQSTWWGRAIFRVDDVDAVYRHATAQGLAPESPTDSTWGERFFHLTDPDGHELSFAQLLPSAPQEKTTEY